MMYSCIHGQLKLCNQLDTKKASKLVFQCKMLNQWNHSANVKFWNALCNTQRRTVLRTEL